MVPFDGLVLLAQPGTGVGVGLGDGLSFLLQELISMTSKKPAKNSFFISNQYKLQDKRFGKSSAFSTPFFRRFAA